MQVHEDQHANGQRARRVETVDNKKHGLAQEWHENGRLRLRATYEHDVCRKLESYRESGQLHQRFDYRYGLLETWHANGQREWQCFLRDGLPVGRETSWDESGQITAIRDN